MKKFFVVSLTFIASCFICILLLSDNFVYAATKKATPTPTPTPVLTKADKVAIKKAKTITKSALKAAEKRNAESNDEIIDKPKINYNFTLHDLNMCYASYYMFYRNRTYNVFINKKDPAHEQQFIKDDYMQVKSAGYYDKDSSDFDSSLFGYDKKIPKYKTGTVVLPKDIDYDTLYDLSTMYLQTAYKYIENTYPFVKGNQEYHLSSACNGWSNEENCYIDTKRSTDDVWYCYIFSSIAADNQFWYTEDENVVYNKAVFCIEWKIIFDDTLMQDYKFPYK